MDNKLVTYSYLKVRHGDLTICLLYVQVGFEVIKIYM